jgi:hypothetical protein
VKVVRLELASSSLLYASAHISDVCKRDIVAIVVGVKVAARAAAAARLLGAHILATEDDRAILKRDERHPPAVAQVVMSNHLMHPPPSWPSICVDVWA